MVTFDERVWQEYEGILHSNVYDDEDFLDHIIAQSAKELRRMKEADHCEFDPEDGAINRVLEEAKE